MHVKRDELHKKDITSRDDLLMGAASKDEDLLESVMHNANGLKTKEVKCIYYIYSIRYIICKCFNATF